MRKPFLALAILTILAASGHVAVRSYIHKTYFPDEAEFICPIKGDNLRLRYDNFGDGHYGAKRSNGRMHNGIDILVPSGEPIFATKSGYAVYTYDKEGYGNYVKIYHKDGYSSRYAHLEAANMRWVSFVKQGDLIGWVGSSGNARTPGVRPHLHFEIRRDEVPIDPMGGCLKERITKK